MLIALIFVMQYLGTLASTPLRTIGIEFSFVLIPIVVGAFLLGPVEGAILGFVFGAMTVVLTVIAPGTMTYILFTELATHCCLPSWSASSKFPPFP